jgi:NTE family protein
MILCFNNLDEPAGSVKREDAPKSLLSGLGNRPWLVLGGGTLRGLAHIGVWEGLQTAGIRFEGVIGTSIGGLVAVALAAGRTASELDGIARRLRKRDILRLDRGAVWLNGIREGSVFRGDTLRSQFETILPARGWGDLEFPVQVNAVDLSTGSMEWFGRGSRDDVSLLVAVCAKTALPVIFPQFGIGGSWYVD